MTPEYMLAKERLAKMVDECQLAVAAYNREVHVDLYYPRIDDGRPNVIVVGLCDVRAAEDIRISFDFERNGWVVENRFGEDNLDWKEAVFIDAMADCPEK